MVSRLGLALLVCACAAYALLAQSSQPTFRVQVCDKNNCFPPKAVPVEAALKVLPGPAVPVEAAFAAEVAKAVGN